MAYDTRLSTDVRIRRHIIHPAHVIPSKARESHPAPHLLLTHAEVSSKLACTSTGPGGYKRKPVNPDGPTAH